MIAFIDEHLARFGVEPICRVLTEHGIQVAPRTYYAAKTRQPWAPAVRDAQVLEVIEAVHADRSKGRGVAGYRKVCGTWCGGRGIGWPGARWSG